MKLTRTILMSFLVMVLVSAWSLPPAGLTTGLAPVQSDLVAPLAATINLQITNKTGAVIPQLTLTGAKNYTFYNIPVGKSTYTVEKGKYKLEYKACGANKAKTLNLTGNKKFNTVSCPVAKLSINNTTGSTLYISLTGPANYSLGGPAGNQQAYVAERQVQLLDFRRMRWLCHRHGHSARPDPLDVVV